LIGSVDERPEFRLDCELEGRCNSAADDDAREGNRVRARSRLHTFFDPVPVPVPVLEPVVAVVMPVCWEKSESVRERGVKSRVDWDGDRRDAQPDSRAMRMRLPLGSVWPRARRC